MNSIFKTLFGIAPDTVQGTCVIMPFDIPNAAKNLGVQPLIKGKLFACAQTKGFTLIRSGMGAGFVGDCVLWLDETPCRNIFFLGTCGIVRKTQLLDIGTVLTPERVFPLESFTHIITGKMSTPTPIQADHSLINLMNLNIPHAGCVSFPSLHEETKHISFFDQLGADVVEMECAAFFAATRKIHRKASALLIASDILGDGTFSLTIPNHGAPSELNAASECFGKKPCQNKTSLAEGINQACQMIKSFCS